MPIVENHVWNLEVQQWLRCSVEVRLSVLLREESLEAREGQSVPSVLSQAAELQPKIVTKAGHHLRVLLSGIAGCYHTVDCSLVGI